MARHSWQGMVTSDVLPRLPELRLTRAVLHAPDVEWLLCAAIEIRSLFSRAFTVEVIVMPLYVPAANVHWLVGERLGRLVPARDRWWDPATTSTEVMGAELATGLRDGAFAYWHRFGGLASFAQSCRARATFAQNLHSLECVAGAAVIAGDADAATEAFESLRRIPVRGPWEDAARTRLARLSRAWSEDRHHAVAILQDARDRTASALGLEVLPFSDGLVRP